MPLLAYNLTAVIRVQEGATSNPLFTLPASGEGGTRAEPVNVTSEMSIATGSDFAAVQTDVEAGLLEFEWTGPEEFNTVSLITKPSLIDRDTTLGYTAPVVFQASWNVAASGQRDVFIQEAAEGLPGIPYKVKIIDIVMYISTAIAGDAELRNTVAGGGSALSEQLSTAATGAVRPGSATVASVPLAAFTPLILDLSEGDCAGEIFVTCVRDLTP